MWYLNVGLKVVLFSSDACLFIRSEEMKTCVCKLSLVHSVHSSRKITVWIQVWVETESQGLNTVYHSSSHQNSTFDTCFFPSVRAHSSQCGVAMLHLGIFRLNGPRLSSGLLFFNSKYIFSPWTRLLFFAQASIFLSSPIWSALRDFTSPDVWSATLLSA